MSTKLVAVAAIFAAAAALAPAANAAGGVRLGFGGPLGTFTATPSKGAVSQSARAPRIKQAARKSRATQPAREVAARPGKAAPRSARAERARGEVMRSSEIVAKADGPGQRVTRLTGSSALIQSALTDTEHDETRAETSTEATAEAVAEREATVDAVETERGSAAEADREVATCSKFIPAVGMTVTVGCDD